MKRASREILFKLYVEEKNSTCKIAKLLGVSQASVWNWLVKYGMPRRKRSDYSPWNTGLTKEVDERVRRNALATSEYWKGHTRCGWSKGLTKETATRLAQAAKYISATRKKMFKEGKLTNWNLGLTKDVDKRVAKNARATSKGKRRKVRLGLFKSWNKGLTKENDERIRRYSKVLSRVCKGRVPWNKGLTKEKDERVRSYAIKLSEPQKRKWQNDDYVRRQMISRNLKPNKPEIKLTQILDNVLPSEYKYVGDGTFILGGRCPDFLNVNGRKKLIELYGDYWHKNDDPQERIDFFKDFGFETLVVWQHELKDIDSLKMKLLEFNGGFRQNAMA